MDAQGTREEPGRNLPVDAGFRLVHGVAADLLDQQFQHHHDHGAGGQHKQGLKATVRNHPVIDLHAVQRCRHGQEIHQESRQQAFDEDRLALPDRCADQMGRAFRLRYGFRPARYRHEVSALKVDFRNLALCIPDVPVIIGRLRQHHEPAQLRMPGDKGAILVSRGRDGAGLTRQMGCAPDIGDDFSRRQAGSLGGLDRVADIVLKGPMDRLPGKGGRIFDDLNRYQNPARYRIH